MNERRNHSRAGVCPDKLSILYVWDSEYPWDVRVEKFGRALRESGHDVHIVARNRRWEDVSEGLAEAAVHRMPPWRFIGKRLDEILTFPAFVNPRWYQLIMRTARSTGADLIIVRDLPLAPTSIAAARALGIPVIFDMAENYPAMINEIWDSGRQTAGDYVVRNPSLVAAVERWSITRVDHIITVVEESLERLVGLGVPRARLSVVSNTPERDRASTPPTRSRRGDGELQLVYLGQHELTRGLVELVDAVAMCRERNLNVRVQFVGRGRDAQIIREFAASRGSMDAIEFAGYLPRADALASLERADVGVIPHRRGAHWNTTIPNKLFDYMAVGTPVIASDAIPTARIVRETRCGEVYASGDGEALASVIAGMASAAHRCSLGEAGRAAILRRYNWEYDSATLLHVVQSVV